MLRQKGTKTSNIAAHPVHHVVAQTCDEQKSKANL